MSERDTNMKIIADATVLPCKKFWINLEDPEWNRNI